MPKLPVLGNDPFQRGAASRPEPEPPAPVPLPVARRAEADPRRDAPKKAQKKQATAPKAAAAPTRAVKPAPKPAAAAAKAAAQTAKAPSKPAAKASPPAPRPPAPRAGKVRPPRSKAAPPLRVLEGELVEEIPRERALAVSELPSAAEPDPAPGAPSWLDHAREQAGRLAGAGLQWLSQSEAGQRFADLMASTPVLRRAMGAAGKAAVAAAPAFSLAARLLPPAVGAARTAVSAVVSGQAARELAAAAVDAGEAVRKVAQRVEPDLREVDDFGEDPSITSRLEPVFDFLHERYFRIKVDGAEHVPEGACLLVCNHSGALPLDGPMLRTVLRRDCRRPDARWLVEDGVFYAPFVGTWLNRLGAVRACPENAERLLAGGTAVAVFPEGLLGLGKTVAHRYQLQRFGRGGFVKLALRTGVPIIPVAVVGAEDATPLLAKLPLKRFGAPYLPVTPTFPLLGPLGLLPLPAQWTISFLPPVDLKRHGPAAADDHALVAQKTEEIRQSIQDELDRRLQERSSAR